MNYIAYILNRIIYPWTVLRTYEAWCYWQEGCRIIKSWGDKS